VKEINVPNIQITDETFQLLQNEAIPLIDSIDSVIKRALDALNALQTEDRKTQLNQEVELSIEKATPEVTRYSATKIPPLKFATMVECTIDGEIAPQRQLGWNTILDSLVRRCGPLNLSASKLSELTEAPFMQGKYHAKGYRFIEEANVSYQGLNSDRAALASFRIAKKIGISLKVKFKWPHDKPEAHRSGETGIISS
jgi:hypothetical protein